jgi:hypothetical protein
MTEMVEILDAAAGVAAAEAAILSGDVERIRFVSMDRINCFEPFISCKICFDCEIIYVNYRYEETSLHSFKEKLTGVTLVVKCSINTVQH